MPNVNRVTSLGQAQATLQHCWTKLSSFVQDYPSSASTASSSDSSSSVGEERQRFLTWLEKWESAFTEYLTNAMATMNSEDITQSRILKTNHLACTILVADCDPSQAAFEAEFNAIIELATAVLQAGYSSEHMPPTSPSTSLDVIDPLMVVISRCNGKQTDGERILLFETCADPVAHRYY
jgi:hypothetical protein